MGQNSFSEDNDLNDSQDTEKSVTPNAEVNSPEQNSSIPKKDSQQSFSQNKENTFSSRELDHMKPCDPIPNTPASKQSSNIPQGGESQEPESMLSQENTGTVGGSQISLQGDSHTLQHTTSYIYNFSGFKELGILKDAPRAQDEQEPFIDPTTELPPQSPQDISLELEGISIYSEKLRADNILVVSCFSQEILMSSVYSLAHKIETINEKRLLTFTGKNSSRSELGMELISETKKIGNGENNLVVIDAIGEKFFTDSLLVYSRFSAIKIKQELKSKNRFLICLIVPELITQSLHRNNQEDIFFEHWNIPFLSSLLKKHFPNNFCELEEKINTQKARGLWGSNERECYELIYGFIKNRKLLEEVNKRESLNENAGAEEIEEVLQPVKVTDLLPVDSNNLLMEKVVLFAATFFLKLAPNDFHRIVSLLLNNKTILITTKSTKATSEGELREVILEEEKGALGIWQKKSDQILRKCLLKATKFQNDKRVIDFSLPYLRREFQEYFEEEYSMFLQQEFRLIQELGLLFDSSPKVTESVIQLYIRMALAYPEDYGDEWLVKIILRSTKQIDVDATSCTTEQELLLKLLEAYASKDFVFERISSLIHEMLNHSQLEEVIERFLEQLISWKQHEAVLSIVKRLRFSPQFNEFHWISQLLERGNEETKSEAYKFLNEQADRSGFRIYEFLEAIQNWLPNPSREKNYSYSNQYALNLFIDYCLGSSISTKFYGQWPSRYPLFVVFSKKDNSAYLNILTTWLFHPGFRHKNFRLNKDNSFNSIIVIGFLLVKWWIILCGFDKNNIPRESTELIENIFIIAASRLSLEQKKEIIGFWDTLTDEYLFFMGYLGDIKFKVFEDNSFIRQENKEFINALNLVLDKVVDEVSIKDKVDLIREKGLSKCIFECQLSAHDILKLLEVGIDRVNIERQCIRSIAERFKQLATEN